MTTQAAENLGENEMVTQFAVIKHEGRRRPAELIWPRRAVCRICRLGWSDDEYQPIVRFLDGNGHQHLEITGHLILLIASRENVLDICAGN